MTATAETVDYHAVASSIRLEGSAWIGNRPVGAESGLTFTVFNPATGEELGEVASCDTTDVDRAVRAARAAFEGGEWSTASPGDRKQTLLAFADLIKENLLQLAVLESLDSGKPVIDAVTVDLPDTIACLRWHAELCDKKYDELAPTDRDVVGMIVREPIGVVAAVLPWNYPLLTAAWKIGPALATGNSLIIKPAELTPLTTIKLAELAAEAGIPEGVFSVIPGLGETAGRAIGLHQDIDAVSFTGSTEVGRYFLEYSAQSNLKRITLECGGKSPCLVLGPIGDLDALAQEATAGYLMNQGENCSAGSRLIVDRKLKEEVVERVAEESRKWTVGNPLDPNTRVGAMIEPAHFEKVMGYVESGIDSGAKVVLGGERVDVGLDGYFVPPTILDEVRNDTDVAREEIFGPVLSVIPVDSVDEGVAVANDTRYGLAASLWTDDVNIAHRVSRELRAGTVSVNCFSEGDNSTPFGGFKQSGFGGRDKGRHSHDQYVELKTIWMAIR